MTQWHIALWCAAAGAAGGALYEIFYRCTAFFRRFSGGRIACDILFGLFYAAAYLAFSVSLRLPPLRLYMCLALAAGFVLYAKSLHQIVAIIAQKVYNGRKQKEESGACLNRKSLCRRKK